VAEPAPLHVPADVVRRADRIGEARPDGDDTDKADDAREPSALACSVDCVRHDLGGVAAEPERLGDLLGNVDIGSVEEADRRDREQGEGEQREERGQRDRVRVDVSVDVVVAVDDAQGVGEWRNTLRNAVDTATEVERHGSTLPFAHARTGGLNAMSDYETVGYDEANGVAWVTLNRPQVHNAFNGRMAE